MKRHGDLFDTCFSMEGLHDAYLVARKGKRGKRSCFEFERRLGSHLTALHDELHSETYTPQPYYTFQVFEPKPRIIHAHAFRDVVVQHAIYRQTYPIFDKTFIDTSFACRVGKGTHRCADYVQQAMRQYDGDRYTLHLDVRKFFYSIDHAILTALRERKIKDPRLLRLLPMFAGEGEIGIPIGNLLCQLDALIYLNPVDHFIKRELKVRHYARYVDDILLIGLARDEANQAKQAIEAFLRDKLRLGLSKAVIRPIRHGVNFVGYRTWRSKRFVRRHSLHRFGRALRAGRIASLNSLMGHALRTSTHRHYCRRLRAERPDLIHSLPLYEAVA
jgi:hypothetical protein